MDERLHALGAKLGGRLVGITHFLVHANTSGPDVCYLQNLFTAEDAPGKGVGRDIFSYLEGERWLESGSRLSDDLLEQAARAIRRYHDATAG